MVHAVWGTGTISTWFAAEYTSDISFFIDNDVNKRGKLFYGKRILHPDEVEEWSNIHIIVAIKSIDAIEEQLKGYGLQSGRDYSMYYDNIQVDFRDADKEIDEIIGKIQCKNVQNSVIYMGAGFREEKGFGFLNEYFNQWKNVCIHNNFLFLLGTKHTVKVESFIEEKTWVIPPLFLGIKYCSSSIPCDVKAEIIQYVESDKELSNAVKLLRQRNKNAQPFYEHGAVYYLYLLISKVMDVIHPKFVIIWNQFNSFNLVSKYVCEVKNIPLVFAEYGVLPGTLAFEVMGQMGESVPTVYAKEFYELPVSTAEYKRAGDIWVYIKNNNLNRKVQVSGCDLEQVKLKLDPSKPVVFYAGQNDAGAGIYPYTEKSQKFHSPIFESSIDAAIYLAEMADRNEWNFIFKPHPYFPVSKEEKELLPSNIIWAENIGVNHLIDLSDVTVTIVSQTAYMALLRDKPALLLGYIQLKDKGCTYQAFEEIKIENALVEAIEKGFTEEQKAAFQKHIAQLVKYYLYDDYNGKRNYRYGKSYPPSFEEIEALEIKLKSMRGDNLNDNG